MMRLVIWSSALVLALGALGCDASELDELNTSAGDTAGEADGDFAMLPPGADVEAPDGGVLVQPDDPDGTGPIDDPTLAGECLFDFECEAVLGGERFLRRFSHSLRAIYMEWGGYGQGRLPPLADRRDLPPLRPRDDEMKSP